MTSCTKTRILAFEQRDPRSQKIFYFSLFILFKKGINTVLQYNFYFIKISNFEMQFAFHFTFLFIYYFYESNININMI